jgi:hypothetical protein
MFDYQVFHRLVDSTNLRNMKLSGYHPSLEVEIATDRAIEPSKGKALLSMDF